MSSNHRLFTLNGVVQHYSWGGYDFIPGLLHLDNKKQRPFAEYWMGAHANFPATVQNGSKKPLPELIQQDPPGILGSEIARKFSGLPYLLKVLDVRQMLSIQVHPSREDAEHGYGAENKKGIPVHAANRNYRDRNHKPELMVALGDFWLLHGFKQEQQLLAVLESKKEFHFLKEIFLIGGYRSLYTEVMTMEQERVNQVLQLLLEELVPLFDNNSLQKASEDYWAARAFRNFCKDGHYDRGIFSIYLFNLVHLKKGEGIFQPAQMPHAYLEGRNVEVMANSDNVLRAGLTDKHIDVQELLRHVNFIATAPQILNPPSGHRIFSSPAEEFELQQYLLPPGQEIRILTTTAETYLVISGSVDAGVEEEQLLAGTGTSMFVTAGTSLRLKALEAAEVFRVTVPGE